MIGGAREQRQIQGKVWQDKKGESPDEGDNKP